MTHEGGNIPTNAISSHLLFLLRIERMKKKVAMTDGTIDKENLEDRLEEVRITEIDVGMFRTTPFQTSDPTVREKWIFLMLDCMEVITKEYGRGKHGKLGRAQYTKMVMEVTTYQEEALLYWYFSAFEEIWYKDFKKWVYHKSDHHGQSPPPPARKKRKGKHLSRIRADLMNELMLRIKKSREGAVGMDGWDKNLLEHAKEKHNNWLAANQGSGETSGDGSPTEGMEDGPFGTGNSEDPNNGCSEIAMFIDTEALDDILMAAV